MLKTMKLREIGTKEQFLYMPYACKQRMRCVFSMYGRRNGGIVLLSACAICAIVVMKCTELGLIMVTNILGAEEGETAGKICLDRCMWLPKNISS
jgi:hypothetical protein